MNAHNVQIKNVNHNVTDWGHARYEGDLFWLGFSSLNYVRCFGYFKGIWNR